MYLKIDKKLILGASKLLIKPDIKKKPEIIDAKILEKSLALIPNVLKYFQTIHIDKVMYLDQILYVDFDKNKFHIKSKDFDFLIDAKINTQEILLYAIDISSNNKFYLNIKIDKNNLNINIASENLDNLYFMKSLVHLNKNIEEWLYDRIKGVYKFNSLSFKYNLKDKLILTDSILLDAKITNAKVLFNNKLKTVNMDHINVVFKNDNLKFEFINPIYNKTRLNDSVLNINNIISKKDPILHLKLLFDSMLNDDVHEIINGYNIKLPIKHDKGDLSSSLDIKLNLITSKLDVSGKFLLNDAILKLSKLDIKTKYAEILMHNNIITINSKDTFLLKSQVFLDIKNMKINTSTKMINSEALIHKFALNNKNNIINIKDLNTKLNISYFDGVIINLIDLNTIIKVNNDSTQVDINKIEKISKYSEILKDNGIKNGSIHINIDDNIIVFKANITNINSPLDLNNIILVGDIINGITNINSIDNKLKIKIDDKIIKINIDNININKKNIKFNESSNQSSKIIISANNSNILLDENKIILADYFKLINNNNSMILSLNYKDVSVNYIKNKDQSSSLNIYHANSLFINSFMGNDDFITSGDINIFALSTNDNPNIFNGEANILDTNFKDFTVINHIITVLQSSSAIVNPLLALPTLYRIVKGDIKFNGYNALKGKIRYTYNNKNNYLNLYDIKTTGAEIDFDGDARLDLNTKTIDSKLKVIFMKDIVNIASKIPLVNMVINKKNKIYSTIKISGDLEDPKSKFILFNN